MMLMFYEIIHYNLIFPQSYSQKIFYQKNVLKNFAGKNRKKPVSESLFQKIVGLQPALLLQKGTRHRFFPLNFAKFFGAALLQNTSRKTFCNPEAVIRRCSSE